MIYVTGNTHGDFKRFAPFKKIFRRRRDWCIVCGDFGFVWNDSKEERKLLARFRRLCCTVLFTEGTHDNVDALQNYPLEDFCGGKARRLGENLFWLQRGHVFSLDGVKVFVLGGGESPDADERQQGVSWWPQEMPTIEELRQARANLTACNDTVDLIVTHQHPQIELGLIDNRAQRTSTLLSFLSEVNRTVVFQHWYFGCDHRDRKISSKMTSLFERVLPALPAPKKSRR